MVSEAPLTFPAADLLLLATLHPGNPASFRHHGLHAGTGLAQEALISRLHPWPGSPPPTPSFLHRLQSSCKLSRSFPL